MEALFTKCIDLSYMASLLILIILVLRICFKKASKSFYCFLWALVGLRLMFPFSIESIFSLIPRNEVIQPTIQTGLTTFNQTIVQNTFEEITVSKSFDWMSILSIIWIIGIVVLMAYSMISYYRLYKKVSICLPYKDNVYYCDDIDSPFILGILNPKIYLPSNLDESQIDYILKHEYAHLKRKDHLWKPLGFALLSIYWFNPMIWIAYIYLCKDIESACDEYVIYKMNAYDKKMYSETLFACSVDRKLILACPLAFGEVGVKERIKTIVNYKKPSFWILCISIIVCIVLGVGFLTEPKANPNIQSFHFTTKSQDEIVLNETQQYEIHEILNGFTLKELPMIVSNNHDLYTIQYLKDNKEYTWTVFETHTTLVISNLTSALLNDEEYYYINDSKVFSEISKYDPSFMQIQQSTLVSFNELYNLIKPYDNGYTDEDYNNTEGEACLHDRGTYLNENISTIKVNIQSDPHRLFTYIVNIYNLNDNTFEKIYVNSSDYDAIKDILTERGFEVHW